MLISDNNDMHYNYECLSQKIPMAEFLKLHGELHIVLAIAATQSTHL